MANRLIRQLRIGECVSRRGPFHLLRLVLLTGVAMLPSGCVQFADPAARGSLMAYDRPLIPLRFHGLWANRLENCGAAGDQGVQMRISAQFLSSAQVTAVEGYSDHPAIMVSTDHPDPAQDQAYLDPSLDGQWLKVNSGYGRPETSLRRCPDGDGMGMAQVEETDE